jgi:hypothetical protein
MPLVVGDHAARVAAAIEWLGGQCGDYAPLRRQFITKYFAWIAAQIEAHRAELVERLQPFEGLYAPEDFFWSALRPLPRGWVPIGGQFLPADMLFWDGTQPVAVQLGERATDRELALRQANVCVVHGELPATFGRFWGKQGLPSSPFRRPYPLSLRAGAAGEAISSQ